jgi:hypothetical protein
MPSPIEKTLDRIGNVVQDIFSGSKSQSTSSTASTTGQTCLEATGMRQRELHLMQNMWRKNDIEYSRPLVLAEYDIQTEFIVSSTDDIIQEQQASIEKAKTSEEKEKVIKRKKKKKTKADKPAPVPGVDKPNKPVETLEEVKPNRYYEMQGNVDTSYEGRA